MLRFPIEEDGTLITETFTRGLLNHCQEEFEKLPLHFDSAVELAKPLYSVRNPDLHVGRPWIPVSVRTGGEQKHRALGLIIFIGHLYMRKIVSRMVVREVVLRLLIEVEHPNEHCTKFALSLC